MKLNYRPLTILDKIADATCLAGPPGSGELQSIELDTIEAIEFLRAKLDLISDRSSVTAREHLYRVARAGHLQHGDVVIRWDVRDLERQLWASDRALYGKIWPKK